MLSAENLECIRNDQILFTQLNLNLYPGDILHIVGENGCGKSSLLQILVGLLLPQAGEVYWQQQPIQQADVDYRQQLIYIGHKIGVKNSLSVLENLQLAASLCDSSITDWKEILSYFNLQQHAHSLCGKMSAGQRQRVALTRLLISKAALWILDEPFTAIDQAGTAALHQLLQQHTARGGMVALTSHQSLQLQETNIKRLALSCHPEQGEGSP